MTGQGWYSNIPIIRAYSDGRGQTNGLFDINFLRGTVPKIIFAGMISSPYPFQYIELESVRLAYIDEGKGDQTILFLHGLSSYALSWKKNIASLQEQYRCIAIDLPGNGLSARGDYPYSIRFFSEIVWAFIQQLNLKQVCLAGHSMGGQIAIYTAVTYPEIVTRLLLCAPAGFETFTETERGIYEATFRLLDFFSSEENSLRKTIQNSFYHYTVQADEMIADLTSLLRQYPVRQYRHMIESCVRGMLDEPVAHLLPAVKQPTQVIFGERDALIPNRMLHPVSTRMIAEAGVALMPNASLEMVSHAGHFVHWEKADRVNECIAAFLEAAEY